MGFHTLHGRDCGGYGSRIRGFPRLFGDGITEIVLWHYPPFPTLNLWIQDGPKTQNTSEPAINVRPSCITSRRSLIVHKIFGPQSVQ